MPKLEKEALKKQTEKNAKLLMSEEFLTQLDAILNAPEGERIDEAAKRLTPEALRKAGVPVPEGLRISSRYFEPGLKRPLQFGDTNERMNALNVIAESSPGILSQLKKLNPEALDRINLDMGPNMLTPPTPPGLGPYPPTPPGPGPFPGPFPDPDDGPTIPDPGIGPLAACGGVGGGGAGFSFCGCFGS